uniref:N-(5'-phosphoribosyl)anthranilate isomerase n=1 Tax=Lipomyces starkeyi TaxID=29829 RepID=TRPF_LIPST|nr:RecName: Full=N-(5'-phosphoribosyl)anthranilate isomerase; Short=PRAI [Lipomyces starkeyi]CAA92584.1 N-(5'-phosphoribosyl)anthranilate isomerase [Lipomyces starkeyi]
MTVSTTSLCTPIVKICGLTVEAAHCAISSGADLIGMILVPDLKRTVQQTKLKAISRAVTRIPGVPTSPSRGIDRPSHGLVRGTFSADYTSWPLVVGVFRNQSLDEVLRMLRNYDLDIVQLHGSEPLHQWTREIPVPVIKKFGLGEDDLMAPGLHAVTLLDGGAGGEGQKISWEGLPGSGAFMLAGGLTVDNVAVAVKIPNVAGVDVSSGVATDGMQDLEKNCRCLFRNAKGW